MTKVLKEGIRAIRRSRERIGDRNRITKKGNRRNRN